MEAHDFELKQVFHYFIVIPKFSEIRHFQVLCGMVLNLNKNEKQIFSSETKRLIKDFLCSFSAVVSSFGICTNLLLFISIGLGL